MPWKPFPLQGEGNGGSPVFWYSAEELIDWGGFNPLVTATSFFAGSLYRFLFNPLCQPAA